MKKINNLIILICICIGIYYAYINFTHEEYTKMLSCLVIIPLVFVPKVFFLITKEKNTYIETIYVSFLLLAQALGSIVGLYHSFMGYDKIVHTISGFVTSFLGIYLLYKFKKSNPFSFNVLFIILTSLSVALLWEVVEYNIDLIFKSDVQWVTETGVNDTMTDMICALSGTILFNIVYAFECFNNKKLLVNKFIDSLE